ncbi:hypothetical protein F9U64_02950 [Gracilibacillus oryzae]|uniref:Uncharacterized protein n=1 Tax=Gracilibacillus oryzae TaxID=1672701 RepID=A0A7C8KS39_9BACI|nr:hypothetical protein [Gracilibacillus oryzae]KAB8138590.1 hypothetical protein F9U64_02950 [Gracilibacillus oryzae]
MWEEVWNEMLRIMDILMITMQKEVMVIIFAVGLLLTGFYILQPFIRILIALEWENFLTFIFVSISGLWLMNHLVPSIDKKYYIYTIITFSVCVVIQRLWAILKMRAKY